MPYLKSTIGKPVKYGPPKSAQKLGASKRVGKVVDEVWAIDSHRDPPKHEHNDPNCWGNYAFVSQLIEWQDGYSIRLTYYHLSCGAPFWRFGGQTSIEAKLSTIKLLLAQTLDKADWFTRQERSTD
jgi:hypothetical protein